jgi:uncharacterized Zn-finger protein
MSQQIKDFEIIEIENPAVACDGGKGALGHPRVYLTVKPGTDHIVCPYCSRKYVLKKS